MVGFVMKTSCKTCYAKHLLQSQSIIGKNSCILIIKSNEKLSNFYVKIINFDMAYVCLLFIEFLLFLLP